MQPTIERLVETSRFSMPTLYAAAWPLVEGHARLSTHLPALQQRLGSRDYRKLAYAILRQVFLIELVKAPKIETTKFRVRWFSELGTDPRGASFDQCVEMASDLLAQLANGWLDANDHLEALNLFFSYGILPYEVPIDYQAVPPRGDLASRIHRPENLVWKCDSTTLRTLRLRKFLTDPDTSPDVTFFRKLLDDKVKIKTYLTDRALTGLYKTNREKRWETHPQSVQFATHHTCLAIEYKLITQVCAFNDFPEQARGILQGQGVLPSDLRTFRCPITLDPISFPLFRDELTNPKHGRSAFQIGHLNPLKLDDPKSDSAGHTADNISWVSEDGNRIQGSLSLMAVRDLLQRISKNYQDAGKA
jgi:hypothetical protein